MPYFLSSFESPLLDFIMLRSPLAVGKSLTYVTSLAGHVVKKKTILDSRVLFQLSVMFVQGPTLHSLWVDVDYET